MAIAIISAILNSAFVPDVKSGELPDDLIQDDDQSRPGTESRSEKTRRQNGRVPEGPRCNPVVDERRHRVNAHRPRDGKENERQHVLHVDGPVVIRIPQEVSGDEKVQKQISVQDDDVPAEQRTGARSGSPAPG